MEMQTEGQALNSLAFFNDYLEPLMPKKTQTVFTGAVGFGL
jgi:hypothetical protein